MSNVRRCVVRNIFVPSMYVDSGDLICARSELVWIDRSHSAHWTALTLDFAVQSVWRLRSVKISLACVCVCSHGIHRQLTNINGMFDSCFIGLSVVLLGFALPFCEIVIVFGLQ